MNDLIFSPGPSRDTVRADDGTILTAPKDWVLLPPGDAALTRRVKTAGDHWVVQEAFHPRHTDLAQRLATAVADHATPVGSGTVARTRRIPVEQRAEAAVIAWTRHKTTAYDSMAVPRIKGKRREVRRMLAERSRQLLARYRRGDGGEGVCPLATALRGGDQAAS